MTDMTREFFTTMVERQIIYYNKKHGFPKPWTADPVFLEYKFCNVFREQDTVTKWVDENIRKPFADHPNLWFMLCIARQINWPDTLQELMDGGAWPLVVWDPDKATAIMDGRRARGAQVYTGAYMIRAEPALPGKSKNHYMCHKVLGGVWTASYVAGLVDHRGNWLHPTLQASTEALMAFYGWGGFMAYEVVTDMRHTRYLCNAPDIFTWANPGPGAKRGLNRLYGRPLTAPIRVPQQVAEMRLLLEQSGKHLPLDFPRLEMRDVEHWLCEFDKYQRVATGEGRPRSKYPGAR
jgi:alpha-glutamyl/putrescinyl thymine pyrophosphorylase clade 1